MSIIQNYVGLDGRIEAIVRSLMGDVDVDLTNYYTKEEVDALIASGGTGTQIDYNDLLNRPIINGLIQSNLDMKNYLLLKNGTTVYLPTVSDDTVRFDKNAIIPNMYTKTEVDNQIKELKNQIQTLTDKINELLMTIKDMNTYEEVLFRLIDLTKEIMNIKTTCGNLDQRIIALEGSKGDIDAVKQNVVELQSWKTTTDETLTNLDARVTALEGG